MNTFKSSFENLSCKTNVAVAEVVCAQDFDPSRPFSRSLYENWSRLNLLVKSGQAAMKGIHNGP